MRQQPFRADAVALGAVLALALTLTPAGVAAQPSRSASSSAVDVPTFIATLDRLANSIEDADGRRVTAILSQIPSELQVTSGNQRFTVVLEPVAQRLADASSDRAHWHQRREAVVTALRAMKADAESYRAEPSPVDGRLHAALGSMLARREFTTYTRVTWWTRLREMVSSWLARFWRLLPLGRGRDDYVPLVLAWLVGSLAAAAVIAAVIRWQRRSPIARIPQDRQTAAPQGTARTWALRAIAAARAGDAGEAVRCAYRAALSRIAEQGTWRIDEARTPREYARLLASDDRRRPLVDDVVRQLERVVYANRAVESQDVARVIDSLEVLECVRPHERAI